MFAAMQQPSKTIFCPQCQRELDARQLLNGHCPHCQFPVWNAQVSEVMETLAFDYGPRGPGDLAESQRQLAEADGQATIATPPPIPNVVPSIPPGGAAPGLTNKIADPALAQLQRAPLPNPPSSLGPPVKLRPSQPQDAMGPVGEMGRVETLPPQPTPSPIGHDTTVLESKKKSAQHRRPTGFNTESLDGSYVLKYNDGVLTDEHGDPVVVDELTASSQSMAVALPYASVEVSRRISSYDLLEELGSGAMGMVFRGFSIRLQRSVAIKLIKSDSRASKRAIQRFHNEAVLAARLRHPNIVGIYDSGTENGLHYFVMELIEGEPLGDRLQREKQIPWREAIELVVIVGRALQYAHDQGVIHRDIKPDNVLIDVEGAPHVADFGLAVEPDSDEALGNRGVVGTPIYMPPEQANAELAAIGPRSDMYSLGAMLYHLVSGQPMFEGRSAISIIRKLLVKEPAPLCAAAALHGVELPQDLEVIVMKAVEKEVDRRYESMTDFCDDLERLVRGEPISARPVSSMERLQKWVWRHRPVLVGVFVAFSVLLTLVVSFALVTVVNIERSSDALRQKDIRDALNQAATVESAIRVNMLQGRADQARELIEQLTKSSKSAGVGSIMVVRTNRSIAYGDPSTKSYVENRLKRDDVQQWIKTNHPDFRNKIKTLQQVGLPSLNDQIKTNDKEFVDIPPQRWLSILAQKEPTTYVEDKKGVPVLVVVRPIENSPKCLICHGHEPESKDDSDQGPEYDEEYYKKFPKQKGVDTKAIESVRALLVMKRSQKTLQETIQKNRRSALSIAVVTILIFGVLSLIFTQLLGIRLQKRRFAS